jgi:20S proteasome alpha/beta subunit
MQLAVQNECSNNSTSPAWGLDVMTLLIAFKGASGIALAADSRLTLKMPDETPHIHYDGEEKLLTFSKHPFVAAAVYGAGLLGSYEHPRPAVSYIQEFEQTTDAELPVKEFAHRLGGFFSEKQKEARISRIDTISLLVAGFDPQPSLEPYGKVFDVSTQGAVSVTERLEGYLGIYPAGMTDVIHALKIKDTVPLQSLPLDSAKRLLVTLIHVSAGIMSFSTSTRGVGGFVDVATITKSRPCKVERIQKTVLPDVTFEGVEAIG